ncbi:MAG: tRNA uridine-5-carboxymethylaminomethyl(34) synthesis GTPase MnmE [Proteobacteria bacterium]|nr:tRNA uridine-5-carboxymethylaminomethyl(34) synthesis GTPase MnmE [Pseudomonadota bacterium]
MDRDTIFAPSTAPGRAGIAVVRISGPAAAAALALLTRGGKPPPPRVATLANLSAAESTELLDRAMVLWFPAPASFTGEDVLELHLHGGTAVTGAVLEELSRMPSLRPAGPGEFTRRAFEGGKLDLTEAEAIADLVDAETAGQRRQALRQMQGALGSLYESWREQLVAALAHVEAVIDFSEEEIPDDLLSRVIASTQAIRDDIARHLADGGVGERIRSGFRIALTGAPNVGKSSLLNALAKRDVAIVTDIPGTTRDVIEVPMDLGGYAAVIVDTAGLRETSDVVEQEGVRRARAAADEADLRLVMIDAGDQVAVEHVIFRDDDLVVVNKIDLLPSPPAHAGLASVGLPISVKTGAGIDGLVQLLVGRVKALADSHADEAPPLTRLRHRLALTACLEGLERALAGAADGRGVELVAEDLRLAARGLGGITGRVDVEELLDRIFSEFCIGK